ncbi:MAG: copper amine oxidase N-terminal domain-containing protein [Peptococcaceae bacterium]|nr:copper amine oxidase N-terminal domain-containing protein [Peptococcaceae bacterium]
MKKFLLTLGVAFSVAAFALPCYAAQKISITLDGVPLSTDVAPVVVKGRTLVPARVIAENMGATVDWKDNNVIINSATGEVITLPVRSNIATAKNPDGTTSKYQLETPAQTRNNRTVVPLRFIAESMGANVDYKDGKVTITTNPLVINTKTITSMTYTYCMTMGGSISEFKGNNNLYQFYNLIQAGKGDPVAAPAYYGRHIDLDQEYFYYLQGNYRFYAEPVVINEAENYISDGAVNYALYGALTGEHRKTPEGYGQMLLHDEDADQWYTFDTDCYEQIENFQSNLWVSDMRKEIFNNIA